MAKMSQDDAVVATLLECQVVMKSDNLLQKRGFVDSLSLSLLFDKDEQNELKKWKIPPHMLIQDHTFINFGWIITPHNYKGRNNY